MPGFADLGPFVAGAAPTVATVTSVAMMQGSTRRIGCPFSLATVYLSFPLRSSNCMKLKGASQSFQLVQNYFRTAMQAIAQQGIPAQHPWALIPCAVR